MKNRVIHCAIAGLGRIGSTLEFDTKREKPASHAGAVSAHPLCEITAGCDTDKQKREAFRKDWNCRRVFRDHREMFNSVNIDILHIATPAESHRGLLLSAIEEKIPVIILEKPVAEKLKDAEEMAAMAESSQSSVIVNHERRYSLQYRRVREMIQRNTYGPLLSIKGTLFMGHTRNLGKMLLDDGTHMVDLINFLTEGPFSHSSLQGSDREGQVFVFGKSGEIPVFIHAGKSRDHLVFELDFSFERGRIVAGNGHYHEYKSEASPFYDNYRSLLDTGTSFKKTEYFKGMFDDAVRVFSEKSAVPVSGIRDGLAAVAALENIISEI